MSNEELAAIIQAGERDYISVLWEQIRGLVAKLAIQQHYKTEGAGGVEIEDLIQCGFLAMLDAIKAYTPAYKFSTYLSYHLKVAFAEAGGYRTSRRDPLNHCISLDTPLSDETDSETLIDIQPAGKDFFVDVEQRIWTEQLHKALDEVIQCLPDMENQIISGIYWNGQSNKDIATVLNIDPQRVPGYVQRAFNRIRISPARYELEKFLDDRTPYYHHVGVSTFNTTRTSSTESAVLAREKLSRSYMKS